MRAKTVFVLLVLLLLACNGAQQVSQSSNPTASIIEPASGTVGQVGQPVIIKYKAADVKGISQIEIVINGQAALVQPIEPAVNTLSAQYSWTPPTVGSYVINLRAFNVDKLASEVSEIFMTVNPVDESSNIAVPTATDTPTPMPTATATLVVQAATITPTEAVTVTPTQTPTVTTSDQPAMLKVVAEAIFVRFGPGTNFPQIGKLAKGETAMITGKDTSGAWWQIIFPQSNNQRGWVSEGDAFTEVSQADSVAVVAPPPMPASNTPSSTAVEPTATKAAIAANPNLPVINSFTANSTSIKLGEQITLKWQLEQAKEAYLNYDSKQEGVISPGEKTLFPQQDTTYTLIARNDAGEVKVEVTVKVDTANPVAPASPSAPALYRFSADKYERDDDEDVTLRWELANAKEAYLRYDDKDKGVVSPGEKTVAPEHDTVYVLEVKNDNGRTRAEFEIKNGSSAPAGVSVPSLNNFSVDRLTINKGESVTLRWDVTNAKKVFLDYDDVHDGVAAPGERVVSPRQETKYILTATNDAGEVRSEITIVVK